MTDFQSKSVKSVNFKVGSDTSDYDLLRNRQDKLNEMINYTNELTECRHVMLTNYFETGSISHDTYLVQRCGNCDNCTRSDEYSLSFQQCDLDEFVRLIHSLSHPVGISKLLEILSGRKTKYAKGFSHLPSYGYNKSRKKEEWTRIANECVRTGKILRTFNEFGNVLYSSVSPTEHDPPKISPAPPVSPLTSPVRPKNSDRQRAYNLYTQEKLEIQIIAKEIGKSEKSTIEYIVEAAKESGDISPADFNLTEKQVKLIQKRLKLFNTDKSVLDTLRKEEITPLQVKICRIITLPS